MVQSQNNHNSRPTAYITTWVRTRPVRASYTVCVSARTPIGNPVEATQSSIVQSVVNPTLAKK